MSDQPPEVPSGRRQRAAPTIDLTATDVSPAAASPEPAPEPPPQPENGAPEPPPPRASRRAIVLAGFAGALLVILVAAGAVWLAGIFFLPSPDDAAVRAQVAMLQKQVQELQNRPAPTADIKSIDALSVRLGKIESEIAKLPPSDVSVGERLAAVDNAVKSLSIALSALSQRSNDAASNAKQALERADTAQKAIADLRESVQRASTQASAAVAPAELAGLTQRLAALEQSLQATRGEMAKMATTDSAARLALSATILRDAVEAGAPYAAELAQARVLGADAKMLAPLDIFAATGLPNKQALAQELRDLLPAVIKDADGGAAPKGFLGRLQANAGKLVSVRPLAAPAGDEPATVLARLETEVARADVDAALGDLAKLPPRTQKAAAAWIAKVKARQAALAAVRALAIDTVRSLAPLSEHASKER